VELPWGRLAGAVTLKGGGDTRVLREFVEHPGLFLTWEDGGKITRHLSDRACIVVAPTFAVVTAIDIAEGEAPMLLEEVRRLVPADAQTSWFLGPSTRPIGLADELLALGLRNPTDGSEKLYALLLDREPSDAPAGIETHEITTLADHTSAAEVRWDAFNRPEEERAHERGFLVTYFEEYLRRKDRSVIAFVATIDGRVAGSANALLSDHGLFLIGGSTAPWARGRGVYRALVGARWRYAVERGTPALAVHAIHDTSAPILRRLGFREVCAMRCLEGL
jgi:hypothetical protein